MRADRHDRAGATGLDAWGEALEGIREASGLTWQELARRLGTSTLNLWRWRNGVRPNTDHLLELQGLAAELGLDDLLPGARPRRRA